MNLRIKLLSAIAMLLCTPIAIAKCYEDADKFGGSNRQWCGAWGTGGIMLGGLMGLDPIPYLVTSENGDTQPFIKIVWNDSDWIFIEPGSELIMILETGEKITLITNKGSTGRRSQDYNEFSGAVVIEEALYPATIEFMEKLSRVKSLEFAIYGQRGRAERKLKKSHMKYFREFYEKVLAPAIDNGSQAENRASTLVLPLTYNDGQ